MISSSLKVQKYKYDQATSDWVAIILSVCLCLSLSVCLPVCLSLQCHTSLFSFS